MFLFVNSWSLNIYQWHKNFSKGVTCTCISTLSLYIYTEIYRERSGWVGRKTFFKNKNVCPCLVENDQVVLENSCQWISSRLLVFPSYRDDKSGWSRLMNFKLIIPLFSFGIGRGPLFEPTSSLNEIGSGLLEKT